MSRTVRTLVSCLALATILGCTQPAEPLAIPDIPHTVLSDEVSDTPGSTQVTQNLLVAPDIAEADLRTLLTSRYALASQRTGFQYHDHPTLVAIYAYPSREHAEAGMGQWSGMILKNDAIDAEPRVSIGRAVGRLPAAAERFGLSVAQRQDVFRQLVLSQDRAMAEAEKQYPISPTGENVMKQIELESQLTNTYREALLKESGLTDDELSEIQAEAFQQNWPLP